MIWVVQQFIIHQTLDTGLEKVKFPIRVEVEYQEENGRASFESLRKKVLYNKTFLLRRCPELKERDLDLLVETRVQKAVKDRLMLSKEGE